MNKLSNSIEYIGSCKLMDLVKIVALHQFHTLRNRINVYTQITMRFWAMLRHNQPYCNCDRIDADIRKYIFCKRAIFENIWKWIQNNCRTELQMCVNKFARQIFHLRRCFQQSSAEHLSNCINMEEKVKKGFVIIDLYCTCTCFSKRKEMGSK